MMRRWIVLLALAACHGGDARPVHDAIIGSWEVQCAIRDESQSICPREDLRHIRHTFRADGSFENRRIASDAPGLVGTWSADGDQVTVHLAGAAASVDLHYRARLDGDQLVLWNEKHGDGSILRRIPLDDHASDR